MRNGAPLVAVGIRGDCEVMYAMRPLPPTACVPLLNSRDSATPKFRAALERIFDLCARACVDVYWRMRSYAYVAFAARLPICISV